MATLSSAACLPIGFSWCFFFSLVALGPSEAYATAADPDAQAKQAYARGAELFKTVAIPEAATAFEEGNKLKPHPAFLYNLALTYRALNQPDKAIEYYGLPA